MSAKPESPPPELKSVRILRLEPGDEIVLTLKDKATHADAGRLREMAEERWPGHRVSVLSAGIDMTVLSVERLEIGELRALVARIQEGIRSPFSQTQQLGEEALYELAALLEVNSGL